MKLTSPLVMELTVLLTSTLEQMSISTRFRCHIITGANKDAVETANGEIDITAGTAINGTVDINAGADVDIDAVAASDSYWRW